MTAMPRPNQLHALPPAYDTLTKAAVVHNLKRFIPAPLRKLQSYLLFKYTPPRTSTAKRGKVPFYLNGSARHGDQGSIADLAALVDFDTAVNAYSKSADGYAGVGVCALPHNPVTFLDLDACIDHDTGALNALAQEIVSWGSYTEVSPGGLGLRCILKGNLGFNRKNNSIGLEIFSSTGFLTLTGLPFGPAKPLIAPTKQQIDRLHALLGTHGPAVDADDADVRNIPAPLTPEKLKQAKQALRHVDPDLGYSDWILIGQALHSSDPDPDGPAFDLWVRWSQTGAKFNATSAEDMLSKWAGFKQQRGITIASLFHYAKAHRWQNPTAPKPATDLHSAEDYVTAAHVQPQSLDAVCAGLFDHIGAYLFVGRAKIGKSRVLGQLIASALVGGKFFDFQFVAPCKVLALALEEDAADVTERCRMYMVDPEDHPLYVVDQDKLRAVAKRLEDVEHNYLDWLDSVVSSLKPRLVIIDSLVKLRITLGLPPETSKRITEQDYEIAEQLQDLADKHQCVVVATIHGSKRKMGFATADFDPFESIGTTSWAAAGCAGLMCLMDPPGQKPLGDEPDDMRRVFSVRTRYRKPSDLHLLLQYGAHGTIRSLGEYHYVKMSEQQEFMLRIIRDLTQETQWATGAAIAREAGINVRSVRRLLERFRRNTGGVWGDVRLVAVQNHGYRLEAL